MFEQLKNIVECIAICYIAWGFFFFCMHGNGVDYIRHFVWTAAYFFAVAVITALVFFKYTLAALQGFTPVPFIVLGIFMAGQLVVYTYIAKHVRAPVEYFEKYPNRDYLKIDQRRLLSKSMDILAQQVFIVLLVTFLKDAGLSLLQTMIAFTFLFALLHIPLIASEFGAWPSWLFGGVVVLFGVLFPLLILKVQYGFVYNMMVHWLFYTIMALSFWGFATRGTTGSLPYTTPRPRTDR